MSNDELWYRDAIIYQLHVKAFHDSNGDGIGDFAGLTQKLDYIQQLGVDTLWLLPFYPSPQRDDGYDIADYCAVHPDYGTLEDVRNFIAEAHRRGLKVITELVINHTSDQHPWFQAARQAPPGSAQREFYVWSDDDSKFADTRIIFTDTEHSNWAWDPVARQYYWHRFFSHQPDLNHNNPAVVAAVIEVMRFWMDMGVDGMRLDAIPYLCVEEGTNNENLPQTHEVLKRIRAAVDEKYQGRMLLAEANQWPEDVREYFGEGDECHMAYHFPLMPRIFMAVALEERYPIVEIMHQTPDIPDNCQWAIFLRNHDELTLEMVTDRERDYMYRMYAQEPRMRINVGIRRRLAPLLSNDADTIKLMNSLLLSMPGSPIIYYGDEIGMGDNIYIGDRNGVRTPMQWSIDRNAGFSRADPQQLYLPVIMDPIYGYQAVNVEAQSRDPSSLLNWTRRILAVRRQQKCFGRGALTFLKPRNRCIIAYVRSCENEVVLCVANLSQTAQAVELDLSAYRGRVPVEMLGRNAFPPIGELPYFLTLPGHGFFWLTLSEQASPPDWHVERLPATELPVLVLTDGIATLLSGTDSAATEVVRRTMRHLQHDVLPEFVRARGWFSRHRGAITSIELAQRALWQQAGRTYLLSQVAVAGGSEGLEHYFLPLTLHWEDGSDEVLRTVEWTLAKVREHARAGVLIDAFADPDFCLSLVRGVQQGTVLEFAGGELRFEQLAPVPPLPAPDLHSVRHVGSEPTNTSVQIGERVFLKAYRRMQAAFAIDIEMSQRLAGAGFTCVAAPLGRIVHQRDGQQVPVAALFEFVEHQGDLWNYTCGHLERHLHLIASEDTKVPARAHELYTAQMQTLGQRIGEMHGVLAGMDDPAFAPETVTGQDYQRWHSQARVHAQSALAQLDASLPQLSPQLRQRAQWLLGEREQLLDALEVLDGLPPTGVKTRVHGNLHLRKILPAADDFLITGFEGDASLSREQRCRRDSPLYDLATLLVSLHYAREHVLSHALDGRQELHDRLSQALDHWLRQSSQALQQGYRRAVSDMQGTSRRALGLRRQLQFFRGARAVQALDHELQQRPERVAAALEAVCAWLQEQAGP